ncbi:hypothetical protein B0H65DRAFT_431319 [Neurospora tetraspora]|uniref:C2H2-type domain-containing protein n=1 Tax=Neurospora tetraspora TaxID=94610 RepID=A0AAE0JAB3_9PEZI|nr:hypothetical protein B0H65DRAFT_431319 [Neurospora tetraspora]
MASSSANPEARSLAAGPYNCPDCTKVFARPCDLNKHSKSHTRPFKCQHSDCKYAELGWPTLKELERHNNDKHSPNPIIYACEYEGCDYESKRESNCKQHMEKAHGWLYTRSKSNGKQPADSSPIAPVYRLKPGPHVASESSTPLLKQSSDFLPLPNHHQDFTLFQDDTDQSVIFDDDDEDTSHHHDAPQLIPWTSPATRLRRNGTMIERFDQTYHGNQALRISDIPVDPSLSDLVPRVLTSAAAPSTSAACGNNGTNTSETSRQTQSSRQQPRRVPGRQRRRNSDAEESRKRVKPNPTEVLGDNEGFTDSTMPCIFRHSHPHLYNKETRDKSDPCHTTHRDISTLARHLLRPAHRLSVDIRMISSFEIQDKNYLHPRVGLCRRCWQPFFDHLEFQSHLDLECEKVSKGKREKWRIMRDLFTPLVQQHNEQSSLSQDLDMAGQENTAHRTRGSINMSNKAGDHSRQDSVSGTATPANYGTLVPSRSSLESEIHLLREENRQLRESLMAQESRRESLASTVHSSAVHLASEVPSGLGLVSAPRMPNSKDSNSDQESLVGYMDSQSTDVDRDGLMSETPETFMRQRQGLGLPSHSTVHHVPTSPSPLLIDSFQDVPNFSQPPTSASLFSARKHPTSLADSAYGTCTDPRRGSLGESGQAGCAPAGTMADISGGPHKNWFNNSSQQRQDGGSLTTTMFGDYQFGNNNIHKTMDMSRPPTSSSSTPRGGSSLGVATTQQPQQPQQQDFSGWSNPNPFATASTSQPSHGLFEDASFDFFVAAQTDCGEETGGYNPTSSSQDFVFSSM